MKQSNFVPVVFLLGGLLWVKAHGKPASGVGTMQDSPVSLENIRKGVARGWYSAVLCTIGGKPAVKLSGTANGKPYSDYYPVTQATWNALKNDGVKSIGACYGVRNVGMSLEEAYAVTTKNEKLPMYDMSAWSRNGSVRPEYGQRVANEVVEALLAEGWAKVYTGRAFQPREVQGYDEKGNALYKTFLRARDGVWRYAGLLPSYYFHLGHDIPELWIR